MSDRQAGGWTITNVPSAQPPGEESQRTLLLDGGRYMKAGMALVLEALSLPSFALEPAGHRVILCNGALARLLNYSQGEGGAVPSALSQLWDGPLPAGLIVEGAEGNARRPPSTRSLTKFSTGPVPSS